MSIRPAAAVLAASAFVLCLAGCASASPNQARPVSDHASADHANADNASADHAEAVAAQPVASVGPPAGSRAEAEEFAQQMLSAVTLPAGARRLSPRRQPALLRTYAGDVVQADPGISPFRLYRVPMPMAAVIAFVQGHLPADVENQDSGKMLGGPPSGSDANRPAAEEYVDAQARRVRSGIDLGVLEYAVVPERGGTSVLQVNAQVVWYPSRPAAEDFSSAAFRAVRLTGYASQGRTVARTFTSRQLIQRVVSLLDRLHVSTTPASACSAPIDGPDGTGLELLPASAGQPDVSAEFARCPGYLIYLGTRTEPPLQPQFPRDRLSALIMRVLGLPRSRT